MFTDVELEDIILKIVALVDVVTLMAASGNCILIHRSQISV